MATGLNDVTWDSTSAKLRLGSTIASFQKFEPSKSEIKVEKLRPVGASKFTKRTPGVHEVGDIAAEMLATDYDQFILPKLPIHGGTLVTFPVTATVRHISVAGSFNMLFDLCRIIGEEGPAFGEGEKGLIYKLTISVMDRWVKGSDGIWKCLGFDHRKPSNEARALMQF